MAAGVLLRNGARNLRNKVSSGFMYLTECWNPGVCSKKDSKKKVYFRLIEKQLAKTSDYIRAVGSPEYKNLKKSFLNTQLIPNGVESINTQDKDWSAKKKSYLFMARLHHKKGVLPLIKAWKKSSLQNNDHYELLIAGPDDGELNQLKSEINNCSNIRYLGAIYGKEKDALLNKSHFYVLASFSEGFPTSVLEGMQYGLIPLISEGCNFPEAFENKLGLELSPNQDDILKTLEMSAKIEPDAAKEMGEKAQSFVIENYSLERIAEQQHEVYQALLKGL